MTEPTDPFTQQTGWLGPQTSGTGVFGAGELASSLLDEPVPESYEPVDLSGHRVTAVLVAHDGQRWLPRVLAGMAAQTFPPTATVAVDTGSRDASLDRLVDAFGPDAVLSLARGTGFGAAVARALTAPALRAAGGAAEGPDDGSPGTGHPVTEWLWLLHDDCAPDPRALEALLTTVERLADPAVAVLGPKVRGWYDRRRLLEVGVTITGGGRRETGLEPREQDQGQHDGVRDVLAVGSAGLLVRRDVWDQLGGFDPRLTMFRDDVDLGWRARLAGYRVVCATDAIVYHAEASTHERRPIGLAHGHAARLNRRNAILTLLANVPRGALLLVLPRLMFGTLLRATAMLLLKAPRRALDELTALTGVLARPGRLLAMRRERAGIRRLPARSVGRYLPRPGAQLRHLAEAVIGVLTSGPDPLAGQVGAHAPVVETGPVPDEMAEMPDIGPGLLRRTLSRPGVLLVLGLTLLSLVASRRLLGAGSLAGGALLAPPASASEAWQIYTAGWHEVGLGSAAPAPPYLAPLAALAWLLLGKMWLALDVLLLGAVPLAGGLAYLALRRVGPATRAGLGLRLWGAAAYALLPVATGAVAQGRFGTLVVLILLPVLALAAARLAALTRGAEPPGWRHAASFGLALSLAVAFVPAVWLLAAVLTAVAVVATVVIARTRRAWRARVPRLLVALAVPVALLMPWSWYAATHPALLLLEAGVTPSGLPAPSPAGIALANPAGPGTPWPWLLLGVALAAVAALARPRRRLLAGFAWAAVVTGAVTAVALTRLTVTVPASGAQVRPWTGAASALTGGGLVLAAVVAAEGLGRWLASSRFGWRQPVAAAVVLAALVAPVAAATAWVARGPGGTGSPLRHVSGSLLPAFVASEASGPTRPRTLVVRGEVAGSVRYTVLGTREARLFDEQTLDRPAPKALDGVVAQLASGRAEAVAGLAGFGVRFVLVAAPVDARLALTLDALPGLTRVSSPGGNALWQVEAPVARATVRAADGTTAALAWPTTSSSIIVPAGGAGRRLVLAERADPGWRASLNGHSLPSQVADGWAQAFPLPAEGGTVLVGHRSGRTGWLWAQLVLLLVVAVVALPSPRRAAPEGPEGEDDESPPGPAARGRDRGQRRTRRRHAVAAAAASASHPGTTAEEDAS